MTPDLRQNDPHLRRALSKTSVAGPHPDADLLTAFAERSLLGREREQMLAHLATCGDCREVVTLAAPDAADELAAVAPAAAGTRRWFPALQMNFLRWGAVAAAVVLFAVAVIIEAPKRTQSNTAAQLASRNSDEAFVSADRKTQSAVTATSPAPAPAETTQPSAAASAIRADADKPAEVAQLEARGREAGKLDALQDLKKEKVARTKSDDRAYTMAAAPPSPVAAPVAGQTVATMTAAGRPAQADKLASAKTAQGALGGAASSEVASARKSNEKDSTVTLAEQQPRDAAPAAKPSAAEMNTKTVSADRYAYDKSANAAPAEPARQRSSNSALYGPGYAAGSAAPSPSVHRGELKSAALRWTVTSDGRVQRSTDGRHWADVAVAPGKSVTFRALVASGDEIWAGGSRGALYYSADAGSTWRPHAIQNVTGDILRLNVNGQTLIISTSSGQTISVSHEAFGEAAAKPATSR